MHVGYRLLAVLALVLGNAFFVAAEFSLVTVRKTRIDQLIAEGSRMARPVRRALDNPTNFIAGTQLGITMASLGLGWVGEPAIAAMIEPWFSALPPTISWISVHTVAAAIAFVTITALHIVLGELVPKTIALQRAEQTAMLVVKPAELFQRALAPFIKVLNGAGRMVVTALGLHEPAGHGVVHSEEELKMLVTASQEAGVLEEDEEQMLHRVFHFSEYVASQMMVPRTEMAAVPADAPLHEVVDLVVRGRHTSLPVYREEVDDVIGIMLVTDLLKAVATPSHAFNVASIAREALTVPETMKADELLRQMRRHRTHQAIVIDEYGGTAGLVTFERVVERIVGQLGGDFGTGGRVITQLPGGAAEVDGLALVSDINEQFGLEIDEDTYTTIGGYLLGALGRRPKLDDTVEAGHRKLTVVALDGLRVARVRID
jgi:CBS domain containing-hemolysin-like protein